MDTVATERSRAAATKPLGKKHRLTIYSIVVFMCLAGSMLLAISATPYAYVDALLVRVYVDDKGKLAEFVSRTPLQTRPEWFESWRVPSIDRLLELSPADDISRPLVQLRIQAKRWKWLPVNPIVVFTESLPFEERLLVGDRLIKVHAMIERYKENVGHYPQADYFSLIGADVLPYWDSNYRGEQGWNYGIRVKSRYRSESYYMDSSGVVRFESDGEAHPESPELPL